MRNSICTCILVLVWGCASYQPAVPTNFEREASIDRPFDEVWNKAVDFFANNDIPLKTVQKDSGLIATEYGVALGVTSLDCGKAPLGSFLTDPTANVNVLVREANGAQVRVNVFGSATLAVQNMNGSMSPIRKVRCESTGEIEAALIQYLN